MISHAFLLHFFATFNGLIFLLLEGGTGGGGAPEWSLLKLFDTLFLDFPMVMRNVETRRFSNVFTYVGFLLGVFLAVFDKV
jgi:hypothetical protein